MKENEKTRIKTESRDTTRRERLLKEEENEENEMKRRIPQNQDKKTVAFKGVCQECIRLVSNCSASLPLLESPVIIIKEHTHTHLSPTSSNYS